MSAKSQGVILWLLAGTGVILMYSAYKNISPTSLIAKTVGAAKSVIPLTTDTAAAANAAAKAQGTKDAKNLFGIDPNKPATPAPENVPGTDTPNFWNLTGYVDKAPDGIEYQYNSQGLQLYAIPPGYQDNPNSFIPASGTINA